MEATKLDEDEKVSIRKETHTDKFDSELKLIVVDDVSSENASVSLSSDSENDFYINIK